MGMDFREALDLITKAGLKGVRLDAGGDLDPRRLSHTGRREVAALLRGRELQGFALGSGLRTSLDEPDLFEARLAVITELFKLASDLKIQSVILYTGNPKGPEVATEVQSSGLFTTAPARLSPLLGGELTTTKARPEPQRRHQTLIDSLDFISNLAEKTGIFPALDPASFPVGDLIQLLKERDYQGCGIHWDPATQLAGGHHPQGGYLDLAPQLINRQLVIAGRDWVRNLAMESSPGQGDLNWPELLLTLSALGFSGPIIADRTSGNQPTREVLPGAISLARMIP